MFYISKIVDKQTGFVADKLHIGYNTYRYRTRRNEISCNFIHTDTIWVSVYDTSDKSEEWYKLLDFLKVISTVDNLKIAGFSVDYLARYRGMVKPKDIDYVLSMDFIAHDTSDKNLLSTSRHKMFGLDLSLDGSLGNISSSLVYGDTIVLPPQVKSLSINFLREVGFYRDVNKVVVSSNFDFSDINNTFRLGSFLYKNIGRDSILVVDGNLSLNYSLFERLSSSIYTRGKLKITRGVFKIMDDFKNYAYNNYQPYTLKGRKFTLADSDFIYVLDYKNYTVTKEKNDGRLKF